MTHPLLDFSDLPRFAELAPDEAQPAVEKLIAEHREKLAGLLDAAADPDFDSLVVPLEEMAHEFARAWSPVSHLQNVLGNSGWRDTYNACLPLVTRFSTELSQNERLHSAYEEVERRLPADAPPARRSLVRHALRDFRLAGVALPPEQKAEFGKLREQLAALQARFDQNVQDATDAWQLTLDDEARLAGLPAQVVRRAARDARAGDADGWRLSLDMPTYMAVMTHAHDRELRQTFYDAWSTRASDQGDDPSRDNREVMQGILAIRHRLAGLVGYANYAEYSLATKMAATTGEVIDFLTELGARTHPTARSELAELEAIAGRELEAWDTAYYLERLKQQKYSVSDEELRQYFPAARVQEGLFGLARRLYGVTISENDAVAGWHDTVRYHEVHDADGTLIGGFYSDLYARSGKRGGAWMDECIIRKNIGAGVTPPVGHLVCNFSPPDEKGVSLLTHNDVLTWFHEFGHMLHHLLTRVDYPSVAGINGVPWDAVELPSQFMENFAWHYDVLKSASGHYETGEPLPKSLFERLERSRYCGAALAMLRQLEFALYDFRIHSEYEEGSRGRLLEVLDEVRSEISLIRHPEYNRFPMSFSHIFAGGYAAGYYSYKWAEVLAADAFSAFEEAGVFDQDTANRFRRSILEVGGSADVMQAFIEFRGRRPELDALLRYSGIGKAA